MGSNCVSPLVLQHYCPNTGESLWERARRSFVRKVPNSEDQGRYLSLQWETAVVFVFHRQGHTGIASKSRMSSACGTPLSRHLSLLIKFSVVKYHRDIFAGITMLALRFYFFLE